MNGWYQLKKNEKGQYSFILKAGNAEVILRSELYESKGSAENGIASVQKNCLLDERFVRLVSSNGKPYFNLRAGNHEVIGSSELYENEANREKGIASVKSNGPTTTIKSDA